MNAHDLCAVSPIVAFGLFSFICYVLSVRGDR